MKNSLSKATIIREQIKHTEDGVYTYRLSSSIGHETASFGILLYSVSIELTRTDGIHTFAESRELFSNKERALLFFDRLVDNLATPINLPYIVEDEML